MDVEIDQTNYDHVCLQKVDRAISEEKIILLN